jgi:hypothetical protein
MLSILAAVTAVFADVVTSDSSGNGGVIIISSLGGIIVGGVIGGLIGNTKNRVGLGVVLGALFWCIGWIIVAILPRKD